MGDKAGPTEDPASAPALDTVKHTSEASEVTLKRTETELVTFTGIEEKNRTRLKKLQDCNRGEKSRKSRTAKSVAHGSDPKGCAWAEPSWGTARSSGETCKCPAGSRAARGARGGRERETRVRGRSGVSPQTWRQRAAPQPEARLSP